ncbi:hypothetical protein OP10G_4765 [Fimbriimonas ginsengisoli Gsoil 348]|uniref:Uncharacterized protein n=1 Tax=Fimbriimonas ginsengisoli Gsoil 348 TaxID=661478 RepID=A0A068NX97_FIMGI|nr:hypothetical protein OP10G_4765 [Fimbriimonas ginsengisoli Gsoil 348]
MGYDRFGQTQSEKEYTFAPLQAATTLSGLPLGGVATEFRSLGRKLEEDGGCSGVGRF